MELLKLQDAAKLLNVSYPTLKQWIYHEKIQSIKTPGGHHRIPRTEIDRLTGRSEKPAKISNKNSNNEVSSTSRSQQADLIKPGSLESISGRNKLLGVVTDVKYDGLLAQVTMDVGGQVITALITRSGCEELGLKKGMRAFALIKATEVMVIKG